MYLYMIKYYFNGFAMCALCKYIHMKLYAFYRPGLKCNDQFHI